MITASIDVTKIDKNKIVVGKKGGKYINLVLIENRNGVDKYGNDGFIAQETTKEERNAGKRGAILGNYRLKSPNGGAAPARPSKQDSEEKPTDDDDDDDTPL